MTETLLVVATALPWLLVWVVAAVIAGIRWSKHPVVSALVVTASVINILVGLSSRMLPMVMHSRGESVASIGMMSAGLGLVGLVGSICMVVAVFAERQGSPASSVSKPP